MVTISRGAANFVRRVLDDPCEINYWIYLETFLPAFMKLWLSLTLVDLEDLVRDNAYRQLDDRRGRGLRGLRHGARGLRGGRDPSVNRYTERGLRTLLVLTEPLEKLGFAMLAYYATDRFFFEWSMLLDNRICDERARGAGFQARDSAQGFFPNPNLGAVACTENQISYGGASVSAFGGSVPNGRYTIIFAISIDSDTPSTPQDYAAVISVIGNIGPSEFVGTTASLGRGQSGDLMVVADIVVLGLGGAAISWGVRGPAVPVGMDSTKCQVICTQTS